MSKLIDKDQLAKLAQGLDARMKAAVAGEKEAREIAVEGIEQAMELEAQRVNQKIADDIAEESALRVAAEGELDAAIKAEVSRADAEEKRIVGLVEGEVAAREAEEAAIRGEIAAETARVNKKIADDIAAESALRIAEEARIEKALEDAIAQEVIDRNAAIEAEKEAREVAVKAEEERALAAEKDLSDRLVIVEGFFGEGEEGEEGSVSLAGVNEAIAAAKKAADDAQDAADAAQAAADTAQGEVDAVELRVDALEAFVEGHKHDEMEQGIADNAAAIAKEVEDREGEITRVEGLVTAEAGARQAAETQIRADFAAADAQVLADAKKHADDAITALVDSAPEAMNTLKELAEAIGANKDVYDAYVEQHAEAMAAMKTELQGEIDSDVAAESALRVIEEARIEGKVDTEVTRAKAEEERIVGLVEAEATAARAAEEALAARVQANEAFVAAQPAVDQAQDQKIQALEEFVEGHSHEGLQSEIDAVEGRVDALETFKNGHSHEAMEQGIAANKAAIEKEVGDRDAAIEAALEPFSTTEEVKAILGNVVSTLALTMENDKVVLKLGGEEGIELASVSLDLATTADIEEILGALDKE